MLGNPWVGGSQAWTELQVSEDLDHVEKERASLWENTGQTARSECPIQSKKGSPGGRLCMRKGVATHADGWAF